MQHIKNVLNLKHLSETLSDEMIAEYIVQALPYFNNDLESVNIVMNRQVLHQRSGVVIDFNYLNNYGSSTSKNISKTIQEKMTSSSDNSVNDNILVDKFLDFYNAYHSDGIKSPEAIAKFLAQSLPHFDSDLNKLNITLPHALSYKNSGSLENFSIFSEYSPSFSDIKPFLQRELNESSFIKFHFDKKTGMISETKGFGSHYISNQISNLTEANKKDELKAFINEVCQSFDNLIKQLPEDISLIKGIQMFDYHGEMHTLIARPLLSLINKIGDPSILSHICQKYPQFKEYYDLESNFYKSDNLSHQILSNRETPLWILQLKQYSQDKKNKHLKVFYENGIIKENEPLLSKEEYAEYYTNIFLEAIQQGDIAFLKNELKKPQTLEIMNPKDSDQSPPKDIYRYPTFITSNIEILKLLKEYNFSFFMKTNPYGKYEILENSAVEKGFKDIIEGNLTNTQLDTDDLLDTLNPFHCFYDARGDFFLRLNNLSQLFPDFSKPDILSTFVSPILSNISAKELPQLFKEYPDLDISKTDVFAHILSKGCYDLDIYKSAIEAGADPRICADFIKKAVSSREPGLKLLKALNKEGVVVVKNADYVFHILHNNPTQAFLTYFDKTPNDVFNKYTYEQNLVWWGCESSDQLKSKLSKVEDVTQNSKDGRSIFHYYATKEYQNTRQLSVDSVLKTIYSSHYDFENTKFDLSYINPKTGANLLHELFTFSVFKSSLAVNVIGTLSKISKNDFMEMFYQMNNNNQTPLDLLFTPIVVDGKNQINNKNSIAIYLFTEFKDKLDYTTPMSDGTPLVDKLKTLLTEQQKILLEEIYLTQMSPSSSPTKAHINKF